MMPTVGTTVYFSADGVRDYRGQAEIGEEGRIIEIRGIDLAENRRYLIKWSRQDGLTAWYRRGHFYVDEIKPKFTIAL